MSIPKDPLESAFDSIASSYENQWLHDPVAGAQRRRIIQWLLQQPSEVQSVLDLGCGPGADAHALATLGISVTAVDISDEMLRHTRARCCALPVTTHKVDLRNPETLPPGPFDAVLSNFGALNCVPLAPVAAALAERIPSGALSLVVVMSRTCPAESISLFARGQPREALFRRRRSVAPMGESRVPLQYYRPQQVINAFQPWFDVESIRGIGVLLPPAAVPQRTPSRWLSAAERLDHRIGQWPLVRKWGDHTALLMRRNALAVP